MLTFTQKTFALAKLAQNRLGKRPKLVNLEVTKLCNARCDFCDYWQTKHEVRLSDYSPVIRKIKPLVTVITGGEPMLRKDLPDIVKQVRRASFCLYTSMITKGDLLSLEKAHELYNAGLNHIAVSIDFPGETHDVYRGIPGLWDHLSKLVPELRKEFKNKSIAMNTIIMEDNLDQIIELAHCAREWGIGISFSSYSVMKTNNSNHFVRNGKIERVKSLINQLIELRRRWKGTIVSTEHYLREIPGYFENGGVPNCFAGINMIQVTPSGHLKRCSEMPVTAHYTEYHPGLYDKTKCTACWYSCRGETEAPIDMKRCLEYIGIWV